MKKIILILLLFITTNLQAQFKESLGLVSVINSRLSNINTNGYDIVRTNKSGIVVWQTLSPSSSDIINLDEEAYNLLGYTTIKNNKITSNPSDYDYWLIQKEIILNASLYPNPTANEITIFIDKIIDNLQLSIFDDKSSIIYNMKIYDLYTNIDLNSLPNGMYFIKLHTNKELFKTYKLCVLQN